MNLLRSLLLGCLLFVIGTHLRGQVPGGADAGAGQGGNYLAVIARSYGDSVRLRWGPGNYAVWEAMLERGVTVTRYQLAKDGDLLPLSVRRVGVPVGNNPHRAAPVAAFEAAGATDDYVAIGGQAIYGESFLPAASEDGTSAEYTETLINQVKESENRYSFGLFAADRSWRAARLMGLALTDDDVDPTATYLYRVAPVARVADLDTLRRGFTSIEVANAAPPIKIPDLRASFDNRRVLLSWDLAISGQYYTSYDLERSRDGLTYEQTNDLPLLPVVEPGRKQIALLVDSLPQNNVPYFYRVVGLTPFGTPGPPSDPVTGMGLDPQTEAVPTLSGILDTDEGGAQIGWNYPAGEASLAGFVVLRSNRSLGPYEPISDLLPADARFFVDPAPLPVNYYRVEARDEYGRAQTTFARLHQLDDETPPAVPTGLRGVILKDGQVILTWDENTEPDLLGYRIWLANSLTDEFTLMSNQVLTGNSYVGETTLNTLSRNLYAKINALDQRGNPSALSEAYTLVRPDTIAPSAPVLVSVTQEPDSIVLTFRQSRDPDLRHNLLQRRPAAAAETAWETVRTYAPTEGGLRRYVTADQPVGVPFRYRLLAEDLSDLQTPSRSVEAVRPDNFIRPGVERIAVSPDRREKVVRLNWTYAPADGQFTHFDVYRAVPGGATRRVGRVGAAEATPGRRGALAFSFTDGRSLQRDTQYEYRIKAVYQNGAASPLSEPVAVNY